MSFDVSIVFIALLGAVAAITLFFYGGALVLHWLEVPDSRQAIAGAMEQTALNRHSATA